jgi:toluene monooxygenase system protein B
MASKTIVFNFEGGYELKLIGVDTDDTMDDVAKACADIIVGAETRPRPGTLRVRRQEDDEPYPRDMKVGEAHWVETQCVVVFYE